MERSTRRTFLAGIATTTAAVLAGCVGGDGGTPTDGRATETATPTETPSPTPSPTPTEPATPAGADYLTGTYQISHGNEGDLPGNGIAFQGKLGPGDYPIDAFEVAFGDGETEFARFDAGLGGYVGYYYRPDGGFFIRSRTEDVERIEKSGEMEWADEEKPTRSITVWSRFEGQLRQIASETHELTVPDSAREG
jgi:hypothetical protein